MADQWTRKIAIAWIQLIQIKTTFFLKRLKFLRWVLGEWRCGATVQELKLLFLRWTGGACPYSNLLEKKRVQVTGKKKERNIRETKRTKNKQRATHRFCSHDSMIEDNSGFVLCESTDISKMNFLLQFCTVGSIKLLDSKLLAKGYNLERNKTTLFFKVQRDNCLHDARWTFLQKSENSPHL